MFFIGMSDNLMLLIMTKIQNFKMLLTWAEGQIFRHQDQKLVSHRPWIWRTDTSVRLLVRITKNFSVICCEIAKIESSFTLTLHICLKIF
jgi:hypothetical protein